MVDIGCGGLSWCLKFADLSALPMAPQKRTVSLLVATMFTPQINNSSTSRSDLQTSQQRITPTGWLHGLVMTADCRMALDEKNSASQKKILYDFFSVQVVSIVFYVLATSMGLVITSMTSPQHKYRQASTSRRWPSARPFVAASVSTPKAYCPIARYSPTNFHRAFE
jgi:hypothetical protein